MEKIRENIKIGLELIKKLDELIERWEIINDYPNYSVSTFGRIKNKWGKIMKLAISNTGYYCVNLYKNGKYKNSNVHRLVGNQFIKNPLNKPFIDHIDGNSKNNSITNLRWATISENGVNRIKLPNNSGHTGIYISKQENRNKRYQVNVKMNNKRVCKCFKTLNEAIEFQKITSQTLQGEFRKQ